MSHFWGNLSQSVDIWSSLGIRATNPHKLARKNMLEGLVISTCNYGLDAFCGRVKLVKFEVSFILYLNFSAIFFFIKKDMKDLLNRLLAGNSKLPIVQQQQKIRFWLAYLRKNHYDGRGITNWFFSCNFELVKVILILMIGQQSIERSSWPFSSRFSFFPTTNRENWEPSKARHIC